MRGPRYPAPDLRMSEGNSVTGWLALGCGAAAPGVFARRVVAVDRSPEVDVEEEPQQMGPEERLFRARQSWPVYVIFAFSVIVAVTLILASR